MHLNACQPPPNTGMQRTALCARKIVAFLKAGIGPTAFPIYQCAAADAQPVRRPWQRDCHSFSRFCYRTENMS